MFIFTLDCIQVWEEKFKQLELYKTVYGDLDVPVVTSTGKFVVPSPMDHGQGDDDRAFSEEEVKGLSRWLKHQRQKYESVQEGKVAAGQALEERFRRLIDLGLDMKKDSSNMFSASRDLTKVKEYRNNLWESRYAELCDYVKEHGHANVPTSDKDYPQLARWVGVQRDSYKAKTRMVEESQPPTNVHLIKKTVPPAVPPPPSKPNALTDARIDQLELIGFEFSVNENKFEEKVKELVAYKEKKGHLRVRHAENKQLYEWIIRQRNLFRDYMQGSGNAMTIGRIAQLEKIGFRWHYRFEPLDAKAIKAAVDIAENGHKKKSGHQPDPSSETVETNADDVQEVEGQAAGEDVAGGKTAEVLGEDTVELDIPREESVENRNDSNRAYDASTNLGEAVRMNQSMIDLFDKPIPIPVGLEPYSVPEPAPAKPALAPASHKKGTKPQLWQQHYEQLVAFQEEHGHCRVPGRYPANPKLGMWVKLQREDYRHLRDDKASPMNRFRHEILEKLGFEWTVFNMEDRRNAWNIRFDELKAFHAQFGNCDVPQKYAPSKALGKWVSKQREGYRAFSQRKPSILTNKKVEQLREIGFRFVVGRGRATRAWDSFFEDLVAFKEKVGHTHIPLSFTSDPMFGKWAYQQRLAMEKRLDGGATNAITKKRLIKLQSIGFAFHVKDKDKGRKRRSDFGSTREHRRPKSNEMVDKPDEEEEEPGRPVRQQEEPESNRNESGESMDKDGTAHLPDPARQDNGNGNLPVDVAHEIVTESDAECLANVGIALAIV